MIKVSEFFKEYENDFELNMNKIASEINLDPGACSSLLSEASKCVDLNFIYHSWDKWRVNYSQFLKAQEKLFKTKSINISNDFLKQNNKCKWPKIEWKKILL